MDIEPKFRRNDVVRISKKSPYYCPDFAALPENMNGTICRRLIDTTCGEFKYRIAWDNGHNVTLFERHLKLKRRA